MSRMSALVQEIQESAFDSLDLSTAVLIELESGQFLRENLDYEEVKAYKEALQRLIKEDKD